MRLAEWRKQEGLTQKELAARIGCEQSFVSLIERVTEPQIPGPDYMRRIYRVTDRAVMPNDFYPIADWNDDMSGAGLPFGEDQLPLLESASVPRETQEATA